MGAESPTSSPSQSSPSKSSPSKSSPSKSSPSKSSPSKSSSKSSTSPPPPPADGPPPSSSPPSEDRSPPENSSPPPSPPTPPPEDSSSNSTISSPPPPSPKSPPQSAPKISPKSPPPAPPSLSNGSPPPPTEAPETPPSTPQRSVTPPSPPSPDPKLSSPPPPVLVPPPSSGSNPVPPISHPTSSQNSSPSPPPKIGLLSPPPSQKSSPSSVQPHARSTKSSHGYAPQSSTNDDAMNRATLALGMVFGIILVVILGGASFFVWKRKRKGDVRGAVYMMPGASSPHDSDPAIMKMQMSPYGIGTEKAVCYSTNDPGRVGKSRSFFGYEELFESTDGFSSQNLLGEGGFGSVYKGKLPDGSVVAVKQLKVGGQQGEREFRAEVKIINRIHHRHLVSLVGYCIHENRRLLVYDYVPNNTLYFHLHGEGAPVLEWDKRVKIAIGAARGIAYLHEDCHPRVIHRDIKSSNILLDSNFDAQVSDFGLAKLVDANSNVITRVVGTFGYMAPEYASTGKLTEKSDVYSFGVVLLELITGRKPVDSSQPQGDDGLVEWARPLLSKALETKEVEALADPRLEGNYDPAEMCNMVAVAAASVRHAYAKRPKMGQIVRALDIMANADLINGVKVGESEIFGALQSSEYRLLQKMAFQNQDFSSEFFNRSSSSSETNQPSSRSESSSPGHSRPILII